MLAERLGGMTVRELLTRISSFELTEWMAHDALSVVEREHAEKEAEMKARVRQ